MTTIELLNARKALAELNRTSSLEFDFRDKINKAARFMTEKSSFVDIVNSYQYLLPLEDVKKVRDILGKYFTNGNEYMKIGALTRNICRMEKEFEESIRKYGKRDKKLLSTFKSCLASHVDYQVRHNAKYFEEIVWQYIITYNQKYDTQFKIDSDLPKTYYENKYLAELIEMRIH